MCCGHSYFFFVYSMSKNRSQENNEEETWNIPNFADLNGGESLHSGVTLLCMKHSLGWPLTLTINVIVIVSLFPQSTAIAHFLLHDSVSPLRNHKLLPVSGSWRTCGVDKREYVIENSLRVVAVNRLDNLVSYTATGLLTILWRLTEMLAFFSSFSRLQYENTFGILRTVFSIFFRVSYWSRILHEILWNFMLIVQSKWKKNIWYSKQAMIFYFLWGSYQIQGAKSAPLSSYLYRWVNRNYRWGRGGGIDNMTSWWLVLCADGKVGE